MDTKDIPNPVALVPTERRTPTPMLKLSPFTSRQFTAITVVFYGALAAANYLVVLRCELTLGYTAAEAGAVLIPPSVIFIALSPVSGALVRRVGPRRLMTAGMLAVAMAFLWLAQHRSGGYAAAILPRVVVWGLGLGLMVTPLTAAVLAAISDVAARGGRGRSRSRWFQRSSASTPGTAWPRRSCTATGPRCSSSREAAC
jgi:MFS family permease